MGNSAFFRGKQRILQRGVKIRMPRNTAGPADEVTLRHTQTQWPFLR